MTQEEIQRYADELAQQYFPDESNIWARRNIEAEFVSEACMRMAKRIERELIEKACEYLKSLVYQEFAGGPLEQTFSDEDIEDFRKAMEE